MAESARTARRVPALLAVAIFAAALAAADAGAATFRAQPAADAYVTAASRGANYGRARTLLVDGSPVSRAYVRFNVLGVSGAINRAVLELSARNGSAAGLVVRRAAGNGWGERTIRFRNAPGMVGPAVSSGGVKAGRVTIDVTSLIPGNGLVTFVLSTRGRAVLRIASRESAASSRPALVVTSNGAPSCASTTLMTDEDAAGERDPACNDPDGDPLSYEITSQGSKGTAAVAGGKLRYTPNPNANGGDSFTYRATDGRAASAPATVTVAIAAVNDPPVCASVALATDEDAAGERDPACSDPDGDPLSYEITSQGSKGAAAIAGGRLRYTPNPNANGSDSFTYRATDGRAASAPATATVAIGAVNDLPVCAALALATDEDTTKTLGPSCTDADADPLTYGIAEQGSKGRASIVGGTLRYEPNANANGADSFKYRAHDGSSWGDPATVSVSIASVNDAPTCTNVSLTTDEETAGTVAPGCSDADGDSLAYEIRSQGAKGTASVAGGELRYQPSANASGGDTFTYGARDASSASASATVSVTIRGANDPPSCASISLTVSEDTPGERAPSCSDADGDTLAYEVVSQGAKGTASVVGGNLRYAPDPNANGDDSFTYLARDPASAASASATVSVTITAVNDAPRANLDSFSMTEDTELAFPAADLAKNDLPGPANEVGQTLTVTRVFATTDTRGRLNVVAGQVSYRPPADYEGPDTFRYDVCDNVVPNLCDTGVVGIDVNPANDAPEALPQAVSLGEDGERTITLTGDDPDGDPLEFTVETLPANGALYDGSGTSGAPIAAVPHDLAGATVTYKPDAGFSGTDDFEFSVSDGTVDSEAALVSITVTGVNQAPVCFNDSFTVEEDGDLWDVVCTDDDGDELEIVATSGPTHGTLDLFSDGSFNYVPAANFHGSDGFTVEATDPDGESDTATVAITVSPVNDAPVCDDTDLVTQQDVAGETDPVCSDVDGGALSYEIVTQGTKGTASVTSAGRLRYVPAAGQTGSDSFTYRARDAQTASGPATVLVTIDAAPNAAPECFGLSLFTTEDQAGSTVTDCEDADGDPLTYQIVDQGTKGTASVTTDDRLRYVPKKDENGTDTFTYRASDGEAWSAKATIDVAISEVNDAPVADDDFEDTVPKDSTTGVAVQVLTGDSKGAANEGGQTLDVTPVLVEEPQHGIANVGTSGADNNKIRYFPDEGYVGADTFVYEVCDDGTTGDDPDPKCDTARVSVTVVEVVGATVETAPVPSSGDAADDSAIWVNPADSAQSVVIGANKTSAGGGQGGLAVYDLSGAQLHYYADGRMNNVDIRDGVSLGGSTHSLVVASNRQPRKISIYRVDPTTRGLVDVAARVITPTVNGSSFDLYGGCLYKSAAGPLYFFVTRDDPGSQGLVQQWRLFESPTAPGKVDAELVRSFNVGTLTEGCVADDQLGHLYVGEEDVGIWKYDADPDGGSTRTLVDSTDLVTGRVRADVEGLTIAYGASGGGYLIASSQGNSSYAVYERGGTNAYVTSFRIDDVKDASGNLLIDGVTDSDGIDISTANLGSAFPNGVFVTQDGRNHVTSSTTANQNFKLVSVADLLEFLPPF